ncbi:MAG: DUF1028 domain-containing protein [Chitinophagales bacterium]
MKKILYAALTLISTQMFAQHTFSIVAVDPVTGEVGSAGASCIESSNIISDIHPGVGAIHTQALYSPVNQNYAEDLMDIGVAPDDIIDSMVANDFAANPTIRQYGVVDLVGGGRSAAYTGDACTDWKGHLLGTTYSIQGNILLGPEILDGMETNFNSTVGNLACKLMAALQGAKVPGADTRCLEDSISALSSFLKVAKPEDEGNDLWLNLVIHDVTGDGIDPIDSLQILFDEIGGCDYTSVENIHSNDLAPVVYPQPAADLMVFSLNGNFNEINIFDMSGKLIFSDNVENKNSIILNIENWTTGIYLYTLSSNYKNRAGKIVIQ